MSQTAYRGDVWGNTKEDHQASIQACRGCLSVYGLFPADSSLSQTFTEVTGVEWDVKRLSSVLCVQCKALVKNCQTFRDKAQRVNNVLLHNLISNDINRTNINEIACKQIGIKPLLEPRHYPPNHFDVYYDADNLKDNEIYIKIEMTESAPQSPETIPSEYSNPQVENFGNLWNSPKKEVFDAIDQDDFIKEEVDPDTSVTDVKGDSKDVDFVSTATVVEVTPDIGFIETIPSASTETPIVKNKSTKNGNKFTCEKCNLKLKTKIILKRHILKCDPLKKSKKESKSHTLQMCNICDFKSSRPYTLKMHMRTHTQEKSAACDICYKKFSRPDYLKIHIKTHTGEKPHACSVCDCKFAQVGTLKIHMRTHTGEKPHICNICDHKFARLDHLKKHYKTHTGEKPHECSICGHKFARLDHLKNHMNTH